MAAYKQLRYVYIYIAYISAYLNGVENINRLSYIPLPPAEVSYKIGSDRER